MLLACCAALVAALPAAAQLVPVRRTFGDRTLPRVRAGVLPVLSSSGRVRVVVRLSLPPLAQYAGRGLIAAGAQPSGADPVAPRVAIVAALLAEVAGFAARAGVDGVGAGDDRFDGRQPAPSPRHLAASG